MARVSGGAAQARRRERRAAAREAVVAAAAPAPVEVLEVVEVSDDPLLAEIQMLAEEIAEPVVAAASLPWDSEDGVMDIMSDIYALLNPGDSWRWWVVDLAVGGGSAILCDGDEGEYYLVNLTYGADKEPVLAPASDWTEVDSEWVAAAQAARATAFAQVAKGEAVEADVVEVVELTAAAVELPVEHQAHEDIPAAGPITPAAETAEVATGGTKWAAMIAPEAKLTDDGRAFAPGAIKWRELPLSLGSMLDTPHADVVTDSAVCGRIDNIWRDGNSLRAEGVFDSGDRGQEIARMVGDGTMTGVSVDLAVHSFEVGPESSYFDEDGNWAPQEQADVESEDSLLDLLFGGEDSIFVVTDGTIGAVTVCPFPAFADAKIEVAASLVAGANPAVWTITQQAGWTMVRVPMQITLVADGEPAEPVEEKPAITASAAGLVPEAPPQEWFDYPEFDQLTPLTVDEDGRVFGHAAAWDVCHIGIPGVCTTAPTSDTGYAYFHLKEVLCDDGTSVSCGTVTLDTSHAGRTLGRAAASRHYDDTGTAVADVVAGEDDWGIWFAGSLRPDVDEAVARKLRGATLSGDWRDVNGNLELVALLAVNVPGFPVPRGPRAALVASGEEMRVTSLIAAGIHVGQQTISRSEKAEMDVIADIAAGAYDEFAG